MRLKLIFATIIMLIAAGIALCEEVDITKVPIKIISIESSRPGKYEHVIINATGLPRIKEQYIEEENKLIFEFVGAKLPKKILFDNLRNNLFYKIEALPESELQDPQLAIYLKKPIEYEVVNLFGKGVVDIEISQARAALPEKPIPPTRPYKKPAVKPMVLTGKTILIDPGHGGIDPGATGFSGKLEKELTLNAALKLEKLLKAAGAKVYLTRLNDITTDFREITSHAGRINADILVGLHYNSFRSPKVHGIETYYYSRKSKKLAQTLQKSMVKTLKRKDRGVKREMIYVLRAADMPSIIVEPLYITNAQEESLAASAGFQDKIAYAILKGIKAYFSNNNG